MKAVTLKDIGQRLGYLRKRARLTQAEAAARVGISDQNLSRIERGVQWTDFEVLLGLARLYDVEWADLMAVQPAEGDTAKRKALQQVADLLMTKPLSFVQTVVQVLEALDGGRTRRKSKKQA